MKSFKVLLALPLLILFLNTGISQANFKNYKWDKKKIYKIVLMDESQLIGKPNSWDSISVTINTTSISEVKLDFKNIEEINKVDEERIVDGKYWFENPHATRYLIGPSAFNIKKGEGYYQNTWLFLNSFNVGLSDNFSIGGGLELISTFGVADPILFFTPKYSFDISNKFRAGGGFLYIRVPDTDLGIVYGIGTYGSTDNNLTFGLGLGFVDGDFSEQPILTFSGMKRINRKLSFISENWIVSTDGYYGFFSYGLRFFGEKIAVDLAFVNNPDIAEEIFIGVPFLDFVVKF